jgi:hypothetical protein
LKKKNFSSHKGGPDITPCIINQKIKKSKNQKNQKNQKKSKKVKNQKIQLYVNSKQGSNTKQVVP